MITTADVRDYVKSFELAGNYYIGKLDNKQDKSFGFYPLKNPEPPVRAIGGFSTYSVIGVTVLVHWNNNANETELASRELYERLYTVKDITINNHAVYMIELLESEPVDVGTDEKGVYERVIDMKIYYERKI